jgi:hypothetical protein
MALRRLFNIASFVSLALWLLASWEACLVAQELHTHQYGIYWDAAQYNWVPVSELSTRHAFYGMLMAVALLAIAPLLWLRRFLAANAKRNRRWRGQCESCGYDLRGSSENCPECGTRAEAAGHENDKPLARIAPGTRSNLILLAIIPAAAGFAILIFFVLFMLSDGV